MVESNPGLGTSGCLFHSKVLWTVRHFLSEEVLGREHPGHGSTVQSISRGMKSTCPMSLVSNKADDTADRHNL